MRQNKPDKDSLLSVINLGDQPVVIASDIEDCAITKRVGMRINLPYPSLVLPTGLAHYGIPI